MPTANTEIPREELPKKLQITACYFEILKVHYNTTRNEKRKGIK